MGLGDAFLAKFNIDGEIQWSTYYGGIRQEMGWSCTLGSAQDVYLCGETNSLTNIATPGSYQPVFDSLNDAFLAKFSAGGVLLWGTYYGGANSDEGHDCCVDIEGNIYMIGVTNSTTGLSSPGAYQETNNGLYDVFIVRFTGDGERLWGTYYGGEDMDHGLSCSTDHIGDLFVAGNTKSHANIASPGAHQTVLGGSIDGLLARFTQDGQRVWGTYYGGENDDDILDCNATLWGDVFLAGETNSTMNIASPGCFQPALSGYTDGLFAKFNQEGTRIWGSYYGGSSGEWLNSCVIDDSVNLYIAGPATSDGLGTPGVFQPTRYNISQAGIVAKFDSAGQRKWATYYSGLGAEHAWCDVDTAWNIYICGQTASPTMFSTPGSYQPVFGGGTFDCYLSRFVQCLPPDTAGIISGPDTVCKSVNAVTFTVEHITNASHYFWTVPSGAIITAGLDTDSIEVRFGPASSSGNLSVYGYNYCGISDTSVFFVTVKEAPMLDLDGPDSVCVNTEASYTATSGMVTYDWNVSSGGTIISGGTASDDTIVINWNIAGQQWITVDATDISGCSAYDPPVMEVFVGDIDTVEVTIITEADTICSGDPAIFIAMPVHGGVNPVFQWQVNGTNVGINNAVFTYIPEDGDIISCILTSSEPCATSNPATSNEVTMTVNPLLPVSVIIMADINPVCEGSPVSFTANAIYGGTSPGYQWMVNGINAGMNSAVFTYIPEDGDIISCILTSSEPCATSNPATSNEVTMTVNPLLPVSVIIMADINPVCEGSPVSFTANAIYGGTSPGYQWMVNGINAGMNSAVFTYIPEDGDIISCILTSSEPCATSNPATSNEVTMTVNPLLPVSVIITPDINPVCSGIPVTYTASQINGGGSPNFQWKVNGIHAGTNSAVFEFIPQNGDVITCTLTSTELCATSNPAISNEITMLVVDSPEVTFTPCFDTITTTDAKPIRLRGGVPLGGTYFGSSVSSASSESGVLYYFDPSIAGAGTHEITYNYINSAGCEDSAHISVFNFPFSIFNCGDSLTDIRDNQKYPTIQIGTQCWMAANLNYGTMISGNISQRDNCVPEKYYPEPCALCSALYQWEELMQYQEVEEIQGLCPPGWHVPSEADWNMLFANWTNNAFAGKALLYNGYSGFNAFLTGVGYFNHGWWFGDFATFFWSSTAHGPYKAWAHGMNEYNYSVSYYPGYRGNAFSVRCLKDQ
jgi:uncharacterized protein (TIGR02145 family)